MIGLYLAKEFCHFEAGVQYNASSFQRNFMLTLDTFVPFRQQHLKHGLFTTAYRYDKPEIREANMIGNLYIDFDVNDIDSNFDHIKTDAIRAVSALKAIFGIDIENIQFYFSGNKGVHFVIPAEVLGIQPHHELHDIFKLVAMDMSKLVKHNTVDTRIYDKVRLFRVPNSLHPKTGLYKVPITFEELKNCSFQEMKVLASAPRKPLPVKKHYSTQANRIFNSYIKQWEDEKKRMANRRKLEKKTTLDFMPPCIQHILDEGAPDGKRNNTLAVLTSYFLQRGVNEEEALARVLEWNDNCTPPQPQPDVEKTVRSIYRAEHRYGCRALKELSICSSSCKLYKDDRGTT